MDYGENWFDSRKHYMGEIPYERDFKNADHIMKSAREKVLGRVIAEQPRGEIREATWSLIRNSVDIRVGMALPKTVDGVEHAFLLGSARYSSPDSVRSQQWLRENGICADKIFPAKSTVDQAGRGAFARRFIRKGSVVALAPVLQINRDVLTVREAKMNAEGDEHFTEHVVRQLLFNYCFGHPKSKVLLLPYGPIAGFINHSGQKPNVAVRWSKSGIKNNDEFLNLPAKQLLKKKFGLVMEFVATEDIQPNNEVLLDYGEAWEEAWTRHEAQYMPPEDAEGYVAAFDMRARLADIEILTEAEQKTTVAYPKNVIAACKYYPMESDEVPETGEIQWQANNSHGHCIRPCAIHSTTRDVNGKVIFFSATMENMQFMPPECMLSDAHSKTVTNIPRKAFTFLDRLSSKDQLMKNAFRHYMVLPDDVFPVAWLENNTSDEQI